MRPLNREQETQMARAQVAAKIAHDKWVTLQSIGRNGYAGTPESFERYMKELTGK